MPTPTQNNFNQATQGMNVTQRRKARTGYASTEGETGANAPVAGQQVSTPATPISTVHTPSVVAPTTTPEAPSESANTSIQSDGRPTNVNTATPATNQANNAPVTPTPTTTPKETPNLVTPEQRTTEIVSHLNEGLKNAPGLFKDQNTFRNAYGYAQKSAQEQAVLDNFYAQNRPDRNAIFNQLISGQTPTQTTTPEYTQANAQYQKLQPYLNASDANIIVTAANGGLLTNDDLAKIQQYNPGLYQAYQTKKAGSEKANSINTSIGIQTKSVGETVSEYLQNISDQIMKNTPMNLADGYEKYVLNNSNVTGALSSLREAQAKVAQNQAYVAGIEQEVRNSYPGLSEGAIQQIVSNRTRSFNAKMTLDSANLTQSLSYLNEVTGLAKGEYDAYQTQFQNNFQMGNEAFSTMLGQNNQAFQANLDLQKSQAQFEQGIQQKLQQANNPLAATQSLVDMYTKMGVIPQRSMQEIYDQVKTDMSQGMTIGQALSRLNQQFQSKPEYKALTQIKGDFAITKIGVDSSGKDIFGTIDKNTGKVTPVSTEQAMLIQKYPNDAGIKNNNPAGLTWGISENLKNKFISAGINFSQGTARPANEGGNYIAFATPEDGLKAYQIALVTGGSDDIYSRLKQWVGTENGDNYATQLMDASGLTKGAKFSELSPEQMNTLLTNQIKRESPGFYELMTGSKSTSTAGVSKEAQDYFSLIQKGTTNYEDVFKKLGGTKAGKQTMAEINSLISSQGGAVPALPDSEPVKKMDDLIGRLDELLKDSGNKLESVSGLSYGSIWDKTFGYAKQQALGNLKFVLKGNTLQQLIDAKAQGATFGALSNEELKMLQESASPLLAFAEEDENGNIIGFKVDETTLKNEVKKIRDIFVEKREKMVNPGVSQGMKIGNQQNATITNTGAGQTVSGNKGTYTW